MSGQNEEWFYERILWIAIQDIIEKDGVISRKSLLEKLGRPPFVWTRILELEKKGYLKVTLMGAVSVIEEKRGAEYASK